MSKRRYRTGACSGPDGCRRASSLALASLWLAACSSTSEREVTPWLKIESTRPVFEIVHVLDATYRDRLYVRAGSDWRETLTSVRLPIDVVVLSGGGAVLVARPQHPTYGWLVFREGHSDPVVLPKRECGVSASVAGHPTRPTILCDAEADQGFLIQEFAADGGLLRRVVTHGGEPGRPYPVGVLADDAAVVVAGGHGSDCVFYAIDGSRVRVLSRVHREHMCVDSGVTDDELKRDVPGLIPARRLGGPEPMK